jgi:hypothetical protein
MARVRLGSSRDILGILNQPGIRAATERAAEAVAENVRAQNIKVEGVPGDVDLPVSVQMVQTDRPHAIVAITHAAGDAVQAKHGALTKAAGEAGLDVSGGAE